MTVRESMQTIMQGLGSASRKEGSENQTPSERKQISNDILNRLNKLNLGDDPRMLSLLEAYPNYTNRLITLFKALKGLNIPLSDAIHAAIAKNIAHLGGVVNLLELVKEMKVDPNSFPIERLFDAAKSDMAVTHSVRKLFNIESLDLDTFKLILTYPSQAYSISQLIIDLQEHAYDTQILIDKLLAAQSPIKNMGTIIELLGYILENNLYYPGVVDILLRQDQYIDTIYEGAKKLLAGHCLSANYFTVLEQNPKNANIFAMNILLLYNAGLIDYRKPEDLSEVSGLGIGALHFLRFLRQVDMLDAASYKKIVQHNNILMAEKVVETFNNLPLFTSFDKKELHQMLELVNKEKPSDDDINRFTQIISNYLIPNDGVLSAGAPPSP
ncbi:hypothetical protein [Legionella micdadei]|nr:hypothetical protein [Legionella micdadei]NSL19106.1 hypothetical protein [Legionella micdadei]